MRGIIISRSLLRNYDLKAIVADARKRQKDSGHPVVSFVAKPKQPV